MHLLFLRRHALIAVCHLLREERQQILLVFLNEVNATVFRHTRCGLHVLALLPVLLYGLLMRVTDANFTGGILSKQVLGLLAHSVVHKAFIDSSLDNTRVHVVSGRVGRIRDKLGRCLDALALHQLAVKVFNQLFSTTIPRWNTCVQSVRRVIAYA